MLQKRVVVNPDNDLENADWIKKVRNGKAQEEDLRAHDEAMKLHEQEREND